MTKSGHRIKHLAQLISKNPKDTFSKFALALELLKLDEVNKAKVLFESVLKQDPDYLGVYYHLGKLNQQTGRYSEAERLYKKGIDVAKQQKDQRTVKEIREALLELKIENE